VSLGKSLIYILCIIILVFCRPLAKCQFFGRPLFNHTLCRNDCLSEAQCIISLNTTTLKESEIEVNLVIIYVEVRCVLYPVHY
jgi:hypothetical protein